MYTQSNTDVTAGFEQGLDKVCTRLRLGGVTETGVQLPSRYLDLIMENYTPKVVMNIL